LELEFVSDFELSREQAAEMRRAETLSRKINLLLDVIMSDTGKPFDYIGIRDGAEKAGYYLSRTRWSLLKSGKIQVVPDEALEAIASVFGVEADYLIQENGKLPERVEAELELLKSLRRAEVRNFAARALGPVDPKALLAIAKILDEEDD
jgi:transcriptional regulator with XRE-family HTH domain